jgi:hypothetical protein
MMMKLVFTLTAALTAALLVLAVPASADPVDEVVSQLRAQGYQIIEVRKTWLGRVKIEAVKGGRRREVVFDRFTGEIRRDYVRDTSGGDIDLAHPDRNSRDGSTASGGNPGQGAGNRSSMSGRDDDRSGNSSDESGHDGSRDEDRSERDNQRDKDRSERDDRRDEDRSRRDDQRDRDRSERDEDNGRSGNSHDNDDDDRGDSDRSGHGGGGKGKSGRDKDDD